MKRRILAFLIVVIMLMALMPTTALAHRGNKNVHNHKIGWNIFDGNLYMHCRIEAGEGGKIWSEKWQNLPGQNATWDFEAVPDAGYRFVKWTFNGNECSCVPYTMYGTGDSGHEYWGENAGLKVWFHEQGEKVDGKWDWVQYYAQAVFEKIPPQCTLDITWSTGGVAYTGSTYQRRFTKTVDIGTDIKVFIQTFEGYIFKEWSGDASGSTVPLIITMDSDKTIKANFTKTYRLSLYAETNGSLGTDISGYYDLGAQIDLNTANPTGAAGYEFKYWEQTICNDYPYTWTRINSSTITIGLFNYYRAIFGPIEYTVTFKDSQGETLDTEAVLHGGDVTSTKDSFTYDAGERPIGEGWAASEGKNITGDKTITVETEYEVTVDIGTGTLSSGDLTQWVAYGGDASEPNVTPMTGYHWDNPKWDELFSNITAPKTITAQYEINTYTVSFIDQNGSLYSASQTIEHGSDAAKPA